MSGRCIRCGCTDTAACVLHLVDGIRTCRWLDDAEKHCDACFFAVVTHVPFIQMADGTGPERIGRNVYFPGADKNASVPGAGVKRRRARR